MILKSSSPGVEHTEETGEFATDVLGVGGELFDCSRRRLEQRGVTGALVLAHEGSQLFGDGKGDQEVMARELAFDLSLKPLLSFVVLASGTVAIAAGNKELLRGGAAIASVKSHPAGFGATRHDGIDDFAMGLGHCRLRGDGWRRSGVGCGSKRLFCARPHPAWHGGRRPGRCF